MYIKSNLIIFFIIIFLTKIISAEAYFDLSENNIKINTDFNGKEIIIFGILEDDKETILTIKGPIKDSKFQNSKIQKKERIFGFWFNTKQITYNNIPSIFFIASSSNVENILPLPTLIKEDLSFSYILENNEPNQDWLNLADMNDDDEINVQDVILLVDLVLN